MGGPLPIWSVGSPGDQAPAPSTALTSCPDYFVGHAYPKDAGCGTAQGTGRWVGGLGVEFVRGDAQVGCPTTGVKSLVPDGEDEFGVADGHGAGEVHGIGRSESVQLG
jgi:hypothetical protein